MSDWGPLVFITLLCISGGLAFWTLGDIHDRVKRIEDLLRELSDNLVHDYEKGDDD